jgi:Protein of unknown function (DUF1579)
MGPRPAHFIEEIIMSSKKWFASALILAAGLAAVVASNAIADASKDKAADKSEFKLPPGWTLEDMQACIIAGTPGKMHERLAQGEGVWQGKTSMWMAPDTEPAVSECTSTVTPIMDGRFVKVEMEGDMPGMGPYHGFGIYGYDNISKKFVSTWIDNHSTGIMNGIGELSSDGKIVTTKYNYTCPLTKKPTVMTDVETITGPNTKTLEMFGTDPKSGKEYKMMSIALTRK